MEPTFSFKAPIWLWKGKAAWHFITLPLGLSKEIKKFSPRKRGFGSVPINATIKNTTWKTSIFPEKKGTYVLPLKAMIRKKEGISKGDTVKVDITFQ